MKKFFVLSVIMLISIGSLSSAAITTAVRSDSCHWQRGQNRFHRRPALSLLKLGRKLDLTDEQRSEIRRILEQERETLRPLNQKLKERRRTFHESSIPGIFDEAKARAFADEQSKILSELIVAHERLKAKLYNILTSEQQQKLEQIRRERRGLYHKN